PVGHAVAEHQNVALRGGVALGRRRCPGEILTWRLLLLLLLGGLKEVAAEPAATAIVALWRRRPPLRRTAKTRETEELRRSGAGDPDQQRDRHRQRDQRAGFGEHAQEGLWLRHELGRDDLETSAILAESGRKR